MENVSCTLLHGVVPRLPWPALCRVEGLLLLNLHEEVCASYTEDSRAGFHLHSVRGIVGNMARDHGQGATVNLGDEFAILRRWVKGKFLQGNLTVWSEGETRVINKSEANATVYPCHQRISFFQQVARFGGRLHILADDKHVTRQGFNLADRVCPGCLCQRRSRYDHRPDHHYKAPVYHIPSFP